MMTEKDNRMAANKAVREWKSHHQQTYSEFKHQVAAIGSGDLSLMERTIGLLDDCMPQNARNFYAYIFKYIGDPDSVKNDQAAFSRYDQLAAECIFNHALISMNFATGRIEQTDSMKQDCSVQCVIPSGALSITGTGANAGGPVQITGTNILPLAIKGILA